MNILFLDSIDVDTFGGYENWIRLAANWLVERGHHCTIAGRPESEYLRRLRQSSNRLHFLELPISGDFNPLTIHRLRRYLVDNRVDIMTVNFNKDIRVGGMAARWYGRTRVVWRIGLDITRNAFAHRVLTPRLVDGIFVPSEGLRRQVTRHGYLTDDMVSVIHTGLELKEFARPDAHARAQVIGKYNLSRKAIIAVSSGRLVAQKGHTHLIDAARLVNDRNPDVHFLWLGNGPLEAELRRKIDDLRLNSVVTFAGMLDRTDMELAGADLMVHAAIDEPFSHAVLEGMRAGLPVVATNVGGTPEAVVDGQTGRLVPSRDPQAMADAILRVAENSDTASAWGRAGQERWRQKFTVDRMMHQVLAYFEQIAGGSVRAAG